MSDGLQQQKPNQSNLNSLLLLEVKLAFVAHEATSCRIALADQVNYLKYLLEREEFSLSSSKRVSDV